MFTFICVGYTIFYPCSPDFLISCFLLEVINSEQLFLAYRSDFVFHFSSTNMIKTSGNRALGLIPCDKTTNKPDGFRRVGGKVM